jgi:toxin ParE1/3/4
MDEFLLSIKADNDLDAIADYTLEVWGQAQTQDYIFNLVESFKVLAVKPELGRSASEYSSQLKKFNYKAHTIFYEPTETEFL